MFLLGCTAWQSKYEFLAAVQGYTCKATLKIKPSVKETTLWNRVSKDNIFNCLLTKWSKLSNKTSFPHHRLKRFYMTSCYSECVNVTKPPTDLKGHSYCWLVLDWVVLGWSYVDDNSSVKKHALFWFWFHSMKTSRFLIWCSDTVSVSYLLPLHLIFSFIVWRVSWM